MKFFHIQRMCADFKEDSKEDFREFPVAGDGVSGSGVRPGRRRGGAAGHRGRRRRLRGSGAMP